MHFHMHDVPVAQHRPVVADALDRALSAPSSIYDEIARNARKLVETRHSLKTYAETMLEVFKAAVDDEKM